MVIYLIIAILIILAGIILAIQRKNDFKELSLVLTLSISLAISTLAFPFLISDGADLVIAVLTAIRYGIIAVGMNVSSGLLDGVELNEPLYSIFKYFLYALYITGPICASMFILSLSRKFVQSIKLIGCKRLHVFSELNEASLAIARSIYNKDKKQKLIFCNYTSDQEDLKIEALEVGGIVLSLSEKVKLLKNRYYEFYEINDDHHKVLIDATELCDNLLKQKNYDISKIIVRCFVDSSDQEMIRDLDKRYGNEVFLRYIDENNAVALNVLRNNKKILAGNIHRDVFVFGSTPIARALFENMIYLLINPESGYTIHLFDKDARNVARDLKVRCPEILNLDLDCYFGKISYEEANYDLRFHDFDIEYEQFLDCIEELKVPDLIFVAGNDDENNHRKAKQLKRLYASRNEELKYPVISCLLKDPDLNRMLNVDENIQYFGNYEFHYDYQTLILPELEEEAKRLHLSYLESTYPNILERSQSEKEEILSKTGFYSYVNMSSSLASALYMEYRLVYILSKNYKDIDQKEFIKEYLSDEQNLKTLAVCEHERWSAYQRLMGWRRPSYSQVLKIAEKYSGRKVKDDDLLLHPAIVDYKDLYYTEIKMDSIYKSFGLDKKTNYIELDFDIIKNILKILNIE